jgi:hypothetical protein
MSIVKRQHYVWRHYLRAWSSKDRIWTYLLEQLKVIPSNLMGVAQQMYFYQLSELSAADGQFLRQFIANAFPPVVRPLVEDFVRLSEEYTKLKQKLAATPPKGANAEDIEQQLRDVEINSLEKVHGKIETSGERLIACRSLADLQALENSDEDGDGLLTAVFFMCVQYFRTRVRKNAAVQSFPPEWTDRVERYWHILSFGMAAALARSIMADANRQFCFIQNTTTLELITGDQPVINILDESIDEQGDVAGLALYYPLAPTCALLLQFTPPAEGATEVTRFKATAVDASEVARYNLAIFKRSEQFVFSSSRTLLDDLLSTQAK